MTAKSNLVLITWICCGLQLTASFQTPSTAAITSSSSRVRQVLSPLFVETLATTESSQDGSSSDIAARNSNSNTPSFYKTIDQNGRPMWAERKTLADVRVGDRLEGVVVQELLDAKKGPKVYLECGVGRRNPKTGTWKLANALLRLGKPNAKKSVTQKRMARLQKKSSIECYVSRIRLGNGEFEVVLDEADVAEYRDAKPKTAVGSLKAGHERIGKVQKLVPYGAFVDIGANRIGLLHIKKVADLYGTYIDKEKGLKMAGLEKGAKIKVQIDSIESKRVFLDFTNEVKEEAEKDRVERQRKKEEWNIERQRLKDEWDLPEEERTAAPKAAETEDTSTTSSSDDDFDDDDDDDPYADYSAEDFEEESYDSYDEDRDIEDSMGLGNY